jgi:hypothetical protein
MWLRTSAKDEWEFGEVVRGVIRDPLGEIYFDPDCKSKIGGWIWFIHQHLPCDKQPPRGIAARFQFAVEAVEESLRQECLVTSEEIA